MHKNSAYQIAFSKPFSPTVFELFSPEQLADVSSTIWPAARFATAHIEFPIQSLLGLG